MSHHVIVPGAAYLKLRCFEGPKVRCEICDVGPSETIFLLRSTQFKIYIERYPYVVITNAFKKNAVRTRHETKLISTRKFDKSFI